MAKIDEELEQRETYGNAPGWSNNQREVPADAAPKITKDAQAESSPADAEAESSPEQEETQQQESQEATASTSQPEPEKKFNMPPPERWEELRQQREAERQRAERAEQLAQLALQKLQTPQAPIQSEVDPYAGMDAATAEFYRNMDKRIEQKAAQLAQQQVQGVLQAVDAGRRELAEIKLNQFRQANPDIKPGSQDEAVIASYVQQGYDLTSAKKLALFDKLEAENRALKGKQAAVPQKRAAAQSESSSGIPQTAGLPGRGGNWKDKAGEVIDKGGSFQDVLKTVFR